MKKLPLWIRTILFFMLFAYIFQKLGYLYTESYSSEVFVIERMIEDRDAFDIVIMGSSHTYCAFDPKIIEDTLVDTDVYNLSIPNLSLAHISLLLEQIIEDGKSPDVLVLEVFSFYSKIENTTQTAFFNEYSNTWNPAYLPTILRFFPIEQWPYPLFPLVNQHEVWQQAYTLDWNAQPINDKEDLVTSEVERNLGYLNDGFRPYGFQISAAEYEFALAHPTNVTPIKSNIQGLERILMLSEQNGIEVIFVGVPFPEGINADFTAIDAAINAHDLPYYNFNHLYADEFNILQYLDVGHVNAHGAVEASLLLSTILAEETGRKLDENHLAPYQNLILSDIVMQQNQMNTQIMLIPEIPTADLKAIWTLQELDGNVLVKLTEPTKTFTFSSNLMQIEGLQLLITFQQEGLEYPVQLKIDLAELHQ